MLAEEGQSGGENWKVKLFFFFLINPPSLSNMLELQHFGVFFLLPTICGSGPECGSGVKKNP